MNIYSYSQQTIPPLLIFPELFQQPERFFTFPVSYAEYINKPGESLF